MATTMTVNGQTIVDKANCQTTRDLPDATHDRFEAARGKAEIKWRTDELMALLRDDSDSAMFPDSAILR